MIKEFNISIKQLNSRRKNKLHSSIFKGGIMMKATQGIRNDTTQKKEEEIHERLTGTLKRKLDNQKEKTG